MLKNTIVRNSQSQENILLSGQEGVFVLEKRIVKRKNLTNKMKLDTISIQFCLLIYVHLSWQLQTESSHVTGFLSFFGFLEEENPKNKNFLGFSVTISGGSTETLDT